MLYLASASPRRAELLRQVGIAFEVMPANVVEVRQAGEPPRAYVERVAADKARFVTEQIQAQNKPVRPVLGADTEVVIDGEILGKPQHRAHGIKMLARLANRSHEVLSAVVIIESGQTYIATSGSTVTFGPLTREDMETYWNSGEPADKAGGYAAQGLAARYISRIEGSFSGIVGLPLFELESLLQKIHYQRP